MRSFYLSVHRLSFCSLAFSLLVLAAGGCGGSTGAISGKVLYQSKPLPGGFVNFQSEGANAVTKTSAIREDGSYSVSGMPVGPAKISVQGLAARRLGGMQNDDGSLPKQKEVYVPPKYGNTETSELKYDVKPGSQPYDIELK